MAKVSYLEINFQTGSDNTFYASWEFDETFRSTTSSTTKTTSDVAVGKWVTIKSGATYYNGVAIPSYVMNDTWQVIELIGDRAVINKNKSGTNAIRSPINVKYLVGETTTGTTTNTVVAYDTLEHYEVDWRYGTGDGYWFSGSKTTTTNKHATYNPPEHAVRIRVTVTPVSKKRKVNDVDTPYWSGTAVSASYEMSYAPPEKPSTPTVTVDKYDLKAILENVSDPRSDMMEFQVYDGVNCIKTGTAMVTTCRATFSCKISAGGDYRVRCRAINLVGASGKVYSAWSDYSASVSAIPSTVAYIKVCRAASETSVYLSWPDVGTADSYDIEYTQIKRYFDDSKETTVVTGIEFNHYEITGLETGKEYFFRVRAVNEKGHSSWSTIASTVIGKKPSAPTTWSSTTTCITGESLTLYWVHNCEDGSNQTYAEVEMVIDGSKKTYTIRSSETEDDENNITHRYDVNTSQYIEGTKILWRVRTAGITKEYGDWSVQRTVDIYAPPTLEFNITDSEGVGLEVVKSFPFYISALAGPNTQAPIGYYVTITSDEVYETIDNVGNPKIITNGEIVYSKYFDTNDRLVVEFSANNVDLQNGINYTVTCTVAMDSGLTAEESETFTVSWVDVQYEPDAEISIDKKTMTAYVRPYCVDGNNDPITNVTLAVYRREFNGEFTELGSNIDATSNMSVTDPHPSLDYARYRIVATDKSTGAISYYDPPGYPIQASSVIIQWNEKWDEFDAAGENELDPVPWNGSMLILPYNIDVQDNHDIDVSMIKYVGRAHPVSYYGTQLGETSTWNVEIPKSDKQTLYGIRRLSVWTGDVYVREPSGSGYWANVSVSFSQKHRSLTIPITLTLTRVEGGI